MSKVLDATCSASSKITADGIEVVGAVILSEGKKASAGVAVMDGDKVWYLTSNAADLKDAIDLAAQALTQAAAGLTAAGSGLDGIAPGSGTAVTAAANQITPLVTQLNQLKEALK